MAEALEQMPETRKAFAAGEVSESRVKMLAQAQALAPDQFAQDEATLVAQVAAAPSRQVPTVLATWKRTTDPQAAETEAERLHHMRALHISKTWPGMVHLSGDLDPASALEVLPVIEMLAEPANLDPADLRTPAQARADALVEVCRRYSEGGQTGRRHPAQVLVTIPWNTLSEGKGIVDTEAGPIGGNTARRLTCDATVSRVLLDPHSVPIEMGRATRVIPRHQTTLLELRDRLHPPRLPMPGPLLRRPPHHPLGRRRHHRPPEPPLLCSRHHTEAHQHDWHPKRE